MVSDSYEQAAQLAGLAFERLAREGLPPTPENYTLWYTYYAGYLPDLNRAVDLMVKLGQPFTPTRCDDLFKRFLRCDAEVQVARESGEQAQKTIESAIGRLGEGAGCLTRSHDTVEELRRELEEPQPIEQVRAILGEVAAQALLAATTARTLGDSLGEAARELAEVRSQLQTARLEAMSDSLTGLANRHAFEERLVGEVKAAQEADEPLALLLADIDSFKDFNQVHGELVGDHLLKLAARLITRTIKGRDQAARVGGDEFAVILPQTALADARVVAEQIRRAAVASQITNRARTQTYGSFALSLGAAVYRPGEPVAALIDRATRALRRAKREGRNRVCLEPGEGPEERRNDAEGPGSPPDPR